MGYAGDLNGTMFTIVGHPAATQQLLNLGWHAAESVDAAIIRFAETGRGDVERIAPHYRLRVGVYRVRFAIDREARTMNVLYIYRSR